MPTKLCNMKMIFKDNSRFEAQILRMPATSVTKSSHYVSVTQSSRWIIHPLIDVTIYLDPLDITIYITIYCHKTLQSSPNQNSNWHNEPQLRRRDPLLELECWGQAALSLLPAGHPSSSYLSPQFIIFVTPAHHICHEATHVAQCPRKKPSGVIYAMNNAKNACFGIFGLLFWCKIGNPKIVRT